MNNKHSEKYVFRLKTKKGVLREVKKHSTNNNYEACGIILGEDNYPEYKAVEVIRSDNIEKSSLSFEVDPDSFIEAHKKANKHGIEVIGFYHSHLSGDCAPSKKDKKGMKRWPDHVWLISASKDKNIEMEKEKDEIDLNLSAYMYTQNRYSDVEIVKI